MKEKDKKTLIVYNWNKYYGKEMFFFQKNVKIHLMLMLNDADGSNKNNRNSNTTQHTINNKHLFILIVVKQ